MPLERSISNAVRDAIKRHPRCWGVKLTGVSLAGAPDWVICMDGRFLAVECKQPGGLLSRLQAWVHRAIEAAGGVVAVVRSRQDVEELFERMEP